ncbi:MAG: NAD-dependent epimerase/dehydratase family protein, partial [Candidatus Gastranaerophilaceae bacterium]
IKKLVFASSSSVYGNCEAKIFSENITNLQQISPYAKSKYQCEELIKTYFQLYNLSAVCLRLFTVFGPRQRPDLAIRKFIEQIKKNEPIIMYGDGTMSRDYTYIDDVINGFVSAIEYENSLFEIINIGSGSPVNLLKLVNIIEKCLIIKQLLNRLPHKKEMYKKHMLILIKPRVC